ncbi:hypothetical protein CHCC15075_4145 [Bacillus licheniformis]|nr:hypothetical protein CHCC15075_4145 [Bacillus licheniformis]TWM56726.1 hypothetical protein CHCC14815_0882 [Bacillus licheniformis]
MAICAAKTRAELFSDEVGEDVLQEALGQIALDLSEALNKHKL